MLPLNAKAERKIQFNSAFYRMNDAQLQGYINKIRDVLISLPDHDVTVRVYSPDQDFYVTSLKISICLDKVDEVYLIKHLDRRNEFVKGADVLIFLGSYYFRTPSNKSKTENED